MGYSHMYQTTLAYMYNVSVHDMYMGCLYQVLCIHMHLVRHGQVQVYVQKVDVQVRGRDEPQSLLANLLRLPPGATNLPHSGLWTDGRQEAKS